MLDEPTAHLDHATAEELAREVLGQTGRSVLWITHGTVGLDQVDRVQDVSDCGSVPWALAGPTRRQQRTKGEPWV